MQTTKTLQLLRHARAMDKTSEQRDIERELNSIGLQNSTRMGINFSKKKEEFVGRGTMVTLECPTALI